eukprot:GEZU01014154.1.p1 GENE.GEZU01014154.1~~GEZU01014154.1.p1  ORF type:complete len:433 (-),score=154.22 GEZU01014154.1:92-1390(-)
MESVDVSKLTKIIEGKTKIVYQDPDNATHAIVVSKDRITAGDGARANEMAEKRIIATKTTANIFSLLNECGVPTHFVRQIAPDTFVALKCQMIPIEVVCRRVATGSFLKRNPGVKEGTRFPTVKVEYFFKDDANHDPQVIKEQILAMELQYGSRAIRELEIDYMERCAVHIFEILERAWARLNVTLVDMKVEFGVTTSGEIVLADVIDNDSWRIWPGGDRTQQKDKQVYRDLVTVTPEAMASIKKNYQWVADATDQFLSTRNKNYRAVIIMGSSSDMGHAQTIASHLTKFGVPYLIRIGSAHKGTEDVLRMAAALDSDNIPQVYIAIAGRSNGLGPVLSGNTAYPVINCPPVSSQFGGADIFSSLRLPSGLGCSTVLEPEAAALAATSMFGLTDYVLWAKVKSNQIAMAYKLAKDNREQEATTTAATFAAKQ